VSTAAEPLTGDALIAGLARAYIADVVAHEKAARAYADRMGSHIFECSTDGGRCGTCVGCRALHNLLGDEHSAALYRAETLRGLRDAVQEEAEA